MPYTHAAGSVNSWLCTFVLVVPSYMGQEVTLVRVSMLLHRIT
jgi:hypothetical protein